MNHRNTARRRWIGAHLVAVIVIAAGSRAQQAFDVASVRPNDRGGTTANRIQPQSGQFTATNSTLRDMIRLAYRLHDSQLAGGPSWIESDRFDIVARPAAPPRGGREDVLLMLRSLLAERFGLRMHREERELPVYILSRADDGDRRPDGLRPSTRDCASNPVPAVPNTAPLDADGWPPCGLAFVRTVIGERGSRTQVKRSAISITELALALQPAVGRPVKDATGLAGLFDVSYEYIQDSQLGGIGTSRLEGPGIFAAVREDLGLQLESARSTVDVMVIDAVEPPSPD